METQLTPDQQKILSFYSVTGIIETAVQMAEVSLRVHEESLQNSPAYRKAYALAQRDSAIALEERARYRAVVGTEDPIYHGGEMVGYRQKFSDRLMIFLLRANHPTKFGRPGS